MRGESCLPSKEGWHYGHQQVLLEKPPEPATFMPASLSSVTPHFSFFLFPVRHGFLIGHTLDSSTNLASGLGVGKLVSGPTNGSLDLITV